MPLDPRIPLMAGDGVPPLLTPAENQAIVAQADNARTVADANRLKLQQEQQAMADTQAIQRVMQESGGDWEAAIPRLRQIAPSAALKFETGLAESRKKAHEALKAELETEAIQTQRGLALLRAIPPGDAEMYAALKDRIVQIAPDLAGALPDQYDPAVLEQIQTIGETAKDAIARNQQSLELLASGKFNAAAGLALSTVTDAEDWQETMEGLREMGIPRQVLAQFGPWSPDAPARAEALAMTPDARADNKRADAAQALDVAQFGETARHNRASEGISAGHLQVSRGNLDVARGNLSQRIAEDKRQAEAAKAGGVVGAKLPAAIAEKVAGVEQSLSVLSKMEKDLPTAMLGPVAGRWTRMSSAMPGVPVPAPVAKYMAEESTLRNAVIKATTGAAMSEPEAARIMEQIPSMTDKPEVWRAKATATRENLSLLRRRMMELSGASGEMPGEPAPTAAPARRVNPFRK